MNLASSSKEGNDSLVRCMAERCLAGEIGGSAVNASRAPECIRLGVDEFNIRYNIGRGDFAAAAARAADRARVATETAAAEAPRVPVRVIERSRPQRRRRSRPQWA